MAKKINVTTSAVVSYNETTLAYIKEIKDYPKLDVEEEKTLFLQNTQSSRNKIIKSNLRFVTQVAIKYQGMGIDLEDLIAFGRIGLIEALDKYDPQRGTRFITCAVWYIRAEIQKSLNELSRTVRVPSHHKIKKGSIGLDTEESEKIALEKEASELDKQDLKHELEAILGTLKPREREAITRFYGIGWEYAQFMEQIAEEMGITNERARQLVRRSEESIKRLSNIDILRKWLK
jgi:RNA polymerase sigma factor (sigma-70 family)